MIFTLEHGREAVAPEVKYGRPKDSSEVLDAINEATRILMLDPNLQANNIRRIQIRTSGCHVALPLDVAAVLEVGFCSAPANVFSMWYEFLEGGPGLMVNDNSSGFNDLVDLGTFPTFFPISGVQKVVAFSDDPEDVLETLKIRGYDTTKKEIFTAEGVGEDIPINSWLNGEEGQINYDNIKPSSSLFCGINSLVKPITKGFVSLFAIDGTDMWFLGKYHPDETSPGYRRYRITASCCSDSECVTMLVKLQYVPLKYDSDVLQIQNLEALKAMVKGQTEKYYGNIEKGMAFHAEAVRTLNLQIKNVNPPTNTMNVRFIGEGRGNSASLI